VKRLTDFPLVYLATPYSKYESGIEQAFIDAAILTSRLLVAGVKVYSPIAHTHPLAIHGKLDPYDHKIWLPFDQAMMDASAAIAVATMQGWKESYGVQHEIQWFDKVGRPIFFVDPDTLAVKRRRRIYVASSWRNPHYPPVVTALRDAGHDVYDFRNPEPGNDGFSWREVDPDWMGWTPSRYVELIKHPVAEAGFTLDKKALDWCDTCVLVLPCGRSAHLEAGYAAGQGKTVVFLLHPDKFEPELMYLLGSDFALDIPSLLISLEGSVSQSGSPA
jgi:hypothetical protein